MKLSEAQARRRLAAAEHGVLATMHPERGVDAVPVVFVLDDDGFVGVPIDLVKPKSSTRLQRVRNLEADPRATLLVEHWDRDDWSRLWWVRAELHHVADADPERTAALAQALEQRYTQYAGVPFAGLIVMRLAGVTGWAAA